MSAVVDVVVLLVADAGVLASVLVLLLLLLWGLRLRM